MHIKDNACDCMLNIVSKAHSMCYKQSQYIVHCTLLCCCCSACLWSFSDSCFSIAQERCALIVRLVGYLLLCLCTLLRGAAMLPALEQLTLAIFVSQSNAIQQKCASDWMPSFMLYGDVQLNHFYSVRRWLSIEYPLFTDTNRCVCSPIDMLWIGYYFPCNSLEDTKKCPIDDIGRRLLCLLASEFVQIRWQLMMEPSLRAIVNISRQYTYYFDENLYSARSNPILRARKSEKRENESKMSRKNVDCLMIVMPIEIVYRYPVFWDDLMMMTSNVAHGHRNKPRIYCKIIENSPTSCLWRIAQAFRSILTNYNFDKQLPGEWISAIRAEWVQLCRWNMDQGSCVASRDGHRSSTDALEFHSIVGSALACPKEMPTSTDDPHSHRTPIAHNYKW